MARLPLSLKQPRELYANIWSPVLEKSAKNTRIFFLHSWLVPIKCKQSPIHWNCSELASKYFLLWIGISGLTFYFVHLVGPRAAFTIPAASCRYAVLVVGVLRYRARSTPPAVLHCKHVVAVLESCLETLLDGITAWRVAPIKEGILPFQRRNGPFSSVLVAAEWAVRSW